MLNLILGLALLGFVHVKGVKEFDFTFRNPVTPCIHISYDGKVLYFNGIIGSDTEPKIYRVDVDSGSPKPIETVLEPRCFAVSPDGRLLSAVRLFEDNLIHIKDLELDSAWSIPFDDAARIERMAFIDDSMLMVSVKNSIVMVNVFDSRVRRLADGQYGVWLGDSTVLLSQDGGNGLDIYRVKIGGNVRYEPIFCDWVNLSNYPESFMLPAISPLDSSFSPDGRFAAFQFDGDIYLADRESDSVRRLTYSSATEHSPAFSSDGFWVAYIRDYGLSRQMRMVSIDGSVDKPIQLPNDIVLSASPDGRMAAFLRVCGVRLDEGTLYILDIESRDTVSLGVKGIVSSCWAPQGDWLAAVKSEDGVYRLIVLRLEGRGILHRPLEIVEAVELQDSVRGRASRTQPGIAGHKPRLVVLAIGISKYANRKQQLNFAADDARSFAEALKRQSDGLFSRIIVKVLADTDATRARVIDNGLEWIARRARKGDVAVIFVAGHGIKDPSSDDYYFLAYDSDFSNFTSSGVLWAYFNKAIRKLRRRGVNKIVLFFDTCHSGAFEVTGLRGETGVGGVDFGKLFGQAEGLWVFSSSKNDETSIESKAFRLKNDPVRAKGHGLFTFAILDGLLNGYADFNGDKIVTTSELGAYVSSVVPDTAAEFGLSQHPFVKGSGTEIPLYKIK